ncbi:unnamed protein product [Spirodela intermedia]|uniref:Uncharacterized protein n=1 Tax=Spirodela intermedia TaxID=51605 RepID=A0A7I8IDD6_SPIIN|nr:unnamed protein product [Spirodela intermedia]CAA6655808.1 unnamed protein product [Spirodela intermedia]
MIPLIDSNQRAEPTAPRLPSLTTWPTHFLREKRVPQSHRYSRVPQVLEWAFQSDWTASPSAREGSWWTQVGSGHTYTRRFTSVVLFCRSFHGRLCPLRCNCRFCSLWNPFLHTSQMKRFVASRVFGDRAITSAYLLGVPGRFLFFF